MDTRPCTTFSTWERVRRDCRATGYHPAETYRAHNLIPLVTWNLIHLRRYRADQAVYVFDRPDVDRFIGGQFSVSAAALKAALNRLAIKDQHHKGHTTLGGVQVRAYGEYVELASSERTVKITRLSGIGPDTSWLTVSATALQEIATLHTPPRKTDLAVLKLTLTDQNLILESKSDRHFNPRYTLYRLTGPVWPPRPDPDESAVRLTVGPAFWSALTRAVKLLPPTARKRYPEVSRFAYVWLAVHPDRLVLAGANGYMFNRISLPLETGITAPRYVGLPPELAQLNLNAESATLMIWGEYVRVETDSESFQFVTGPCYEGNLDDLTNGDAVPVVLPYADLAHALKTVAPIAKTDHNIVRLALREKTLTVAASSAERGDSAESLDLDSVPSLVALPDLKMDLTYLKKALDGLNPGAHAKLQPVTLLWTTHDTHRPLGLTTAGQPDTWIMPMIEQNKER
jgi:hypothetical protein